VVTKNNIRVCHLTSVHPPFDIRIFHKECKSLAQAGYNVFLIAPIKEPILKEGIQVIPIHLPKSRLVRFLVVTFKMWVKALGTKAAIYHFHDPELMFCGVLLRLSGKKVIFDIHENIRLSLQSKDWLPEWALCFVSASYFIMERFCLMFFHQLILAEESYLNHYPKHKSEAVLNFPLAKPMELPEKKWNSAIRFVYSGVIHPLRGIWEMLALIQMLKEAKTEATLDLVGEVRPAPLALEIKNYLNIHQLNQNVFIHGKVDFDQVTNFLKNADIGLALLKPIPNYKESLPTKIFEYMQHGLPVIANDFPLYKKYVEATGTGICIDIASMETAFPLILSMIQSSDKLAMMRGNGPKTVTENYSWKTQEQKLLSVYQNLT